LGSGQMGPGMAFYGLRTNTNIRYSENLVGYGRPIHCYGIRNEQNCQTLLVGYCSTKIFLFVDFHKNYV